MKNRLLVALFTGIAILACNKDKFTETPKTPKSNNPPHSAARFTGDSTETATSQFISMSVANQMITSYLYSINSTANDTDIRSFTVSADSLRAFLANTSIKNVKLIFAHTMSYINAGNSGVNAGYQSGALTIVIAAYDTSGNYVYYGGNVLDHLIPCPYTCPSGSAGNDLLQ
jgi:hypothetical protein